MYRKVITLKIDEELLRKLDEEAYRRRCSRSELIRIAIYNYLGLGSRVRRVRL